MSGNPRGAKPYAGRATDRASFWQRRVRFRERRVAPAGPEGLRATLEAGGDGSMVRIRSQDAATLRAVLERHGATVTPGLDEGVLFVTDMGAAQVAELAAIRGIILSE